MNQPFVSVIIPVLNVSSTIDRVLESLIGQTYPADRFEVIMVDNGSEDDTVAKLRKYPVQVLIEDSVKSPYAARNRGLEQAQGAIIALTDGNKIPAADWIENGVECLQRNGCDLAGGRVEFIFSERKTFGEIYDSITFLDNEKYVKEEKASLAGNLFFRREILDKIGNFPARHRSGMDIYWSRKAHDAGFKIEYCPEAVVSSIARPLGSTLRKSYRVGLGHPLNMYQAGRGRGEIIVQALRTFLPPSPARVYRKMKKSGESDNFYYLFPLWGIEAGRKIAMGLGRMAGLRELFKTDSER